MNKRISFILVAAFSLIACVQPLFAQQPPASQPVDRLGYTVPESKRIRVIISTDAANEVDDQYAIVHAMLTPQFIVKGIVAAHFNDRVPNSMDKSYAEIEHILKLMEVSGTSLAIKGSAKPLTNEKDPSPSAGSELIVSEAMSGDPHKLYVMCCGALTDVASAYLQHPEIAGKLTIVWSGGGPYPRGGREFNLSNDINAANVLFGSPIELWQVPSNAYSMVRVGTAELLLKVHPCGSIGAYLVDSMMAFNELKKGNKGWPRGEDWTLGDSPSVSLMMNSSHTDFYDTVAAPRVNSDCSYTSQTSSRKIRVYNTINGRYILEDMFAKLQLAYGQRK